MKIAVFYENLYESALATGRKIDEVLRELRDAGMEMLYTSMDAWLRDRKDLSRTMEKLDLRIEGMHAHCDFPGDPDTELYRELIDTAAESGAGNLLIVPGFLSTGNTRRDIDSIVNGMRRAAAYGQAKNLPVLMEDFDGLTSPYNSIAGLQYFMDSVEGLGCAFDTGNFAAFHEDETEAYRLFRDRICTVHLKDRVREPRHPGDNPFLCADGKKVYACAIGSGEIRIAEILRDLHDSGYAGNVIVELYAIDPRYAIADAFESIAWLKQTLAFTD